MTPNVSQISELVLVIKHIVKYSNLGVLHLRLSPKSKFWAILSWRCVWSIEQFLSCNTRCNVSSVFLGQVRISQKASWRPAPGTMWRPRRRTRATPWCSAALCSSSLSQSSRTATSSCSWPFVPRAGTASHASRLLLLQIYYHYKLH